MSVLFAPQLEVRSDKEYVRCPAGCGQLVRLDFTTIGGELVEIPAPCSCHPDCACVAPNGSRVHHCRRCGAPFARRIQTGRVPYYCEGCR